MRTPLLGAHSRPETFAWVSTLLKVFRGSVRATAERIKGY
jgi:hypothetical protein